MSGHHLVLSVVFAGNTPAYKSSKFWDCQPLNFSAALVSLKRSHPHLFHQKSSQCLRSHTITLMLYKLKTDPEFGANPRLFVVAARSPLAKTWSIHVQICNFSLFKSLLIGSRPGRYRTHDTCQHQFESQLTTYDTQQQVNSGCVIRVVDVP
jgi:hypothetical protein